MLFSLSFSTYNDYVTHNSLTVLIVVQLLSCVQLFATPGTAACQASLFITNSRSLFPSPGDLPNPGIEPRSSALQADCLPAEPQRKPSYFFTDLLSVLVWCG